MIFFVLNNGEKILEKTTKFSKTILVSFLPRLLYLFPGKVPLLPAG